MCLTESTQLYLQCGQGKRVCCGLLRCLALWGRGWAVACNEAYFPTSVTASQELSGQPPGSMLLSLWCCDCRVTKAPFLITFPMISPSHLVSHGGGMIPCVKTCSTRSPSAMASVKVLGANRRRSSLSRSGCSPHMNA